MGRELWLVIHAERSALAHDLARLRPWQWEAQSMCGRWTVREVAAHLTAMSMMTPGRFIGHYAGAGLRLDAMNAKDVREQHRTTTAQQLNEFRAHISDSTCPPWPTVLVLGEIILHGQDIVRPLKLNRRPPQQAILRVADFYKRTNVLVGARRRIAGLRLRATDADWSHGRGPEVSGSLLSLTLAMAGRAAAMDDLSGYGLDTLRSR
ncbi:MAG: maleylpyruvate isomerase family mycothiol-dependent enzyme [Pseudonocardiales bacterium]